MKKFFFLIIAIISLIAVIPAVAQAVTAAPQDVTDVMNLMQSISILGIPFLPLVIVISLTQGIKLVLLKNMIDKLKKILTFVTPLVIAAIVHLIFTLLPDGSWLKYAQAVAGTWAFAALGFDGIKSLFYKTPEAGS